MRVKSFKKKIGAGVLATFIIGSVGTAFAATDAGVQLRTWYNTQFENVKNAVYSELATYVEGTDKTFEEETGKIMVNERGNVAEKGRVSGIKVTNEIKKTSDEYKTQIENESKNIKEGMPAEFDNAVASKNLYINGYLDGRALVIQNNINEKIYKATDSALWYVDYSKKDAMKKASTTLNDAINNAKGDIENQIGNEKVIANKELKDNVDKRTSELLQKIGEDSRTLAKEQETKIQNKAEELEASAKIELENIVKGIE